MDIEYQIHAELTETLLDQIPLSAPKFTRRLRQIHTLLKKSLRLKGGLTPPISMKRSLSYSREFLAGSTYNVSSIDALLERLAVQGQKSVDWLPKHTEVQLTASAYVDRFKKWILHSHADELNYDITSERGAQSLADIQTDWANFKQTAFDHRAAEHVPPQSIHTHQNPLRAGEMSMTSLMAAYSAVVSRFFHSRLSAEQVALNVFQELKNVETSRRDLDTDNFELMWNLLETQMSQVDFSSEEATVFDLLRNTCTFYESSFALKVRETAYSQVPRGDMLAYVRLYARNALADLHLGKPYSDPNDLEYDTGGDAIWSVLYYLLRAGMTQEARAYCRSQPRLTPFVDNLERYLTQGWLEMREIQDLMVELFQGDHNDIYKKAIFAILCRHNIELEELQSVSIEDYLWIKLKLVHAVSESEMLTFEHEIRNYKCLTLTELQEYIKDESQTQLRSIPLLFSLALISALCYGDAIKFLHAIPELEVAAVHLAIGLNSYNLLPEIHDLSVPFEYMEGVVHVNLNELIAKYVKKFQIARPNEALMYIAMMTTPLAQVNSASAVVIESGKYEIVLNPDAYIFGTRWKELVGLDTYIETVYQIANYARASLIPEAVVLFDLVEAYEDMIDVWVKMLKVRCKDFLDKWSEMYSNGRRLEESKVQIDTTSYISRLFILQFNKLISHRINEQYPGKWQSLLLLESIASFYEATAARSFISARQILLNSQLVPLGISRKVKGVSALEGDVKEELPDLVATAIQVLDSMIRGQSSRQRVVEVQEDIKGLVGYFGELEGAVGDCKAAVNRYRALGGFIRDIRKQLVLTQT